MSWPRSRFERRVGAFCVRVLLATRPGACERSTCQELKHLRPLLVAPHPTPGGSSARRNASLSMLPSVRGISKKRRSACVPPEPSFNSTLRPDISRQFCESGTQAPPLGRSQEVSWLTPTPSGVMRPFPESTYPWRVRRLLLCGETQPHARSCWNDEGRNFLRDVESRGDDALDCLSRLKQPPRPDFERCRPAGWLLEFCDQFFCLFR